MILAVISDDFTGALDTGVQFFKAGFRTTIFPSIAAYQAEAAIEIDVVVINSETRHLTPSEAYQTVRDIVRHLMQLGCKTIYKKTDSVLRGNIGAELSAVIDASANSRLVFAPAFPDNFRFTVGGVQYFKDTPVHLTPLGNDPFDPLTTSDVSERIRQQSDVPVYSIKDASSLPSDGIVVVDSLSNSELENIARCCLNQSVQIFAGYAGFADALASSLSRRNNLARTSQKFSLPTDIFVVSGSINTVTMEQQRYCRENGYQVLIPTPEQKLCSKPLSDISFDLHCEQQIHLKNRHTLLASSEVAEDIQIAAQYAKENGLSLEQMRTRICQFLAAFCCRFLRLIPPCTLVVFGGDTLFAIAQELEIKQLYPVAEIAPGIVLSQAETAKGAQWVISKSGGFGAQDLMKQIENICEGHQQKKNRS